MIHIPESRVFDSIHFTLMPGKPGPGFESHSLYNQAYGFWKDFWNSVYHENGTDHVVRPDDFLRQDWISVLSQDGRIIGLHTYTLFDLKLLAAREHSYFARGYTDKFMDALKERNVNYVMTLEFFSMGKGWRAPKLGLSLAAVLAGLGITKVSRELGVDAIISVIRSDIGVDRMAREFGAISLDSNVPVHGTPCELMAFLSRDIRSHSDPRVNELVDDFWNRRTATPVMGERAAA